MLTLNYCIYPEIHFVSKYEMKLLFELFITYAIDKHDWQIDGRCHTIKRPFWKRAYDYDVAENSLLIKKNYDAMAQ